MVLVTAGAGYVLGTTGALDLAVLLHTLVGTGFAAGGTNALNQVWERETDARMPRTRGRPLPSGALTTAEATTFAVTISASGLLYLWSLVGAIPTLLVAVTLALYIFVYTPLKRRTSWCTDIGAVPGALPILVGWVAAGGGIGAAGLSLVAILYFWQLPHFYALAWNYREDYRAGGYRVLSVSDPDGRVTGRRALFHAVMLLPISLGPWAFGVAGTVYLPAALGLGAMYVTAAARMARRPGAGTARALFHASIWYLPLLLLVLVISKLLA